MLRHGCNCCNFVPTLTDLTSSRIANSSCIDLGSSSRWCQFLSCSCSLLFSCTMEANCSSSSVTRLCSCAKDTLLSRSSSLSLRRSSSSFVSSGRGIGVLLGVLHTSGFLELGVVGSRNLGSSLGFSLSSGLRSARLRAISSCAFRSSTVFCKSSHLFSSVSMVPHNLQSASIVYRAISFLVTLES